MKKFQNNNEKNLVQITCNMCGKEILVENGIAKEDFFQGKANWGYFSHKDGETHSFDLCEECYDKLTSQFQIPVQIEEDVELL